ncbi:MAG TPA: ferredoxin [Acidimicrobiales bacterium]|nr:ferredoxin [Acidimicrobiales bacterium]
MDRPMKVMIETDRCTGHGRCYSLAPDLFDSDDEGHGLVNVDELPAERERQAQICIANCPEGAIAVVA